MPQIATNGSARTARMVDPRSNAIKDVDERTSQQLGSQGWILVADMVGVTAARPTTGLRSGYRYFDTTLGKLLVWIPKAPQGGMVHAVAPDVGFWTDGTGAAV